MNENVSSGIGAQRMTRQCIKYWVRLETIDEIVATVREALPLFKYNRGNDLSLAEGYTYQSSVYFDDANFNQYFDRLRRKNRATLCRVRWYDDWLPGGANSPEGYMELKTHFGGWTGGSSMKERLLCGTVDKGVGEWLESANAAKKAGGGKTAGEVELGQRIATLLRGNDLKPKVLTTYRRLAFQKAADASLRISVDRDLRGVLVSPSQGWPLSSSSTTTTSYSSSSSSDWFSLVDGFDLPRTEKFPFAVLEVKIEKSRGEGIRKQDLIPRYLHQFIANGSMVEVSSRGVACRLICGFR